VIPSALPYIIVLHKATSAPSYSLNPLKPTDAIWEQMSKISNDGSVQSGTGCLYSCTHKAAVGVKRLIFYKLRKVHSIMPENIDRLTDIPLNN